MASPQLEDGYTRLANEIIEALMRTNLSAYQSRVLWAIWRETYGFQKKQDWLSNTQLVTMTGIRKQHISRTIKELLQRNIVTKSGYKIAFNKDYQQWRDLPKRVTVTNSGYRVTSTGVKCNQFRGTQKKKVFKERNMSESDKAIFDDFYKAYPKHEGKQAAFKVWKKLSPNSSLCTVIMEALEKQKVHKDTLKKTGAFCPEWPLPTTWLNGKRWEDELPVELSKTVSEGYFANGRADL